jgi:Flp pilus assembly protein TadD
MTGKAGRTGGGRPAGNRGGSGKANPGRSVPPRSAASGHTGHVGGGAAGSLYERYKDALRRAHVAALRDRNEAAIDAYGEAAMIAPDRALPHASIGGIFVRMGRLDEAITAYDRALDLGPRDETALRGIAEAFTRSGRRTEAAAALDRLAEVLDGAGRLADACDASRRALELAESRVRRRQVESIAARLRAASPGDEAAQRALDQALRVLDPTASLGATAIETEPKVIDGDEGGQESASEAEPAAEAEAAPDGDAAQPEPQPEPEAEMEAQPELATPAQPEPQPEPVPIAEPQLEPESQPVTEPEPIAEPVGLGIALGAAAEAALFAGDLPAAQEGLLAAARAHRRAGRGVAAVDACYLAISITPADPELHLLLAELYLDRGWRSQAADKLLLLGRLADLDADADVRQRLCQLIASRMPDEPRVAELCA